MAKARLPYELSGRYAAYTEFAQRVCRAVDASAETTKRGRFRAYVRAIIAAKPGDLKAALRAACIEVTGEALACGGEYQQWNDAVRAVRAEVGK